MGNATFVKTKTYDDGTFLTEAQLDATVDGIVTGINTDRDNLSQIIADCFVSGYTLDDDAAADRTNTLEDKQTATDTHVSNIALGTSTDVAFTDVDATNAKLTFTPEVAGKYMVTFEFPWKILASAGTTMAAEVYFRLIDANSNASTGTVCAITASGADAGCINHVKMSNIFTFTAAEQAVRLQKRIVTATNIGTHQIVGTAGSFGLYMAADKI